MGLFGAILGGFADAINSDIKKYTGVDLAKEFKDTKDSYDEYKESRKEYDDLLEHKDEYIEKYGKERYLEIKEQMEAEIDGNMDALKSSFHGDIGNSSDEAYSSSYDKWEKVFRNKTDEQLKRVDTGSLTQAQADAYYDECSRRGI